MRERYIRQVKKALLLSRKKKAGIVRDLQEAFASASEHGETDREVIDRLGSPEEFAADIHEQLGIDARAVRKRRERLRIGGLVLAALAALTVSAAIHFSKIPSDRIGQADAMTSIQVTGAGIDPAVFCLAFGLLAALVAAVFIVQYARKR